MDESNAVIGVIETVVVLGGFIVTAAYIGHLCVEAWRESRAKRRAR